jgi:hypothetical protein
MIVRDPETTKPASDAQISYLYALVDSGVEDDLVGDDFVSSRLGREIDGATDITMKEARTLIDELKELGCTGYSREDY